MFRAAQSLNAFRELDHRDTKILDQRDQHAFDVLHLTILFASERGPIRDIQQARCGQSRHTRT